VPNEVRRMRWGAGLFCNLTAGQTALCLSVTAMKLRRRNGATSSVACAPASPRGEANGCGGKRHRCRNAKPSPRGEGAERREADEVGRESFCNLAAGQMAFACPALPWSYGGGEMPPHQSASAASFPSRGSQWPRWKAAPPPQSLPLPPLRAAFLRKSGRGCCKFYGQHKGCLHPKIPSALRAAPSGPEHREKQKHPCKMDE